MYSQFNYDECFVPSGMMVSFTMSGKEGQTHNYTRNYMRVCHNNILQYDFVTIHKMVNTGRPAKITIRHNKVTFLRCYGAKNPPQCASAKFW